MITTLMLLAHAQIYVYFCEQIQERNYDADDPWQSVSFIPPDRLAGSEQLNYIAPGPPKMLQNVQVRYTPLTRPKQRTRITKRTITTTELRQGGFWTEAHKVEHYENIEYSRLNRHQMAPDIKTLFPTTARLAAWLECTSGAHGGRVIVFGTTYDMPPKTTLVFPISGIDQLIDKSYYAFHRQEIRTGTGDLVDVPVYIRDVQYMPMWIQVTTQ